MENIVEKHQKELKKIFGQEGVVLAYLFGSRAKGKIHHFSDFDFGVLLDSRVHGNEYFDKTLNIASKIGGVLKSNYVDVVILNQAKPFLRYQVVFGGIPIFVKDRGVQVLFENRVMKKYHDTKHILKTSLNAMTKRIKQGTFGKPLENHGARS